MLNISTHVDIGLRETRITKQVILLQIVCKFLLRFPQHPEIG